ncbi:MAG: hypothetical protein JNK63_05970 [Chthonomonas sp.]|nr:hypothetical protein [Chthonomonas sp.]
MRNKGKFDRFGREVLASVLLALTHAAHAGTVAVADYSGNRVVMVDDVSGVFRGSIANGGGLLRPFGFAYGPDGLLYVSSYGTNQVKRYNSLGIFVDNYLATPKPAGLTFYDRDLVVANQSAYTVTRNGIVSWTSPVRQGRIYQSVVIKNGHLYVSFNSTAGGGIEEFDPNSGASMGDLIPTGRGIWDAQGFGWGPDGTLYVTSSNSQKILRFNSGGQSLGSFTTAGQPLGLRFNSNGELLSTIWSNTQVARIAVPGFNALGGLLPESVQLVQPWYIELVNPSIECQMTFGGRTNPVPPSGTVTVEIGFPGTGTTIQSRTATIQSSGKISILAPSFLSEYDLRIKFGTFLTQTRRVDTRDSSRSKATFDLVNGDCDGSDTVDASDYRLLVGSLGKSQGESGYDSRADLTGDNTVNAADVAVFSASFSKTGLGQ